MSKVVKLAFTSITLNVLSLLIYTLVVSNAAFQGFTLATEILSVMGVVNLTLSVIALSHALRQDENQRTRNIAWSSLIVGIGMILVIVILLLNIWVFNFRA